MGTINQVIEGREPNDVTFIKAAMVLWRSPKKGPHPGKNGDWYSFDLLVSDESVPKDAEGKDGRFVSFGDHPNTDDIRTGDTVEFKLKFNEFKNKKGAMQLSLKGSYLKKVESTPSYLVPSDIAPSSGKITPPADNAFKQQVEEYQSLIKEVIDPLFNKLWGRLPKDQQTEFYNANMGLVKAINRYLPE